MSTKERILSVCMTLILAAGIFMPVTLYAQDVTVTVNGRAVNFDGQAPLIIDGRTFVPLRGVFEALGFTVGWDSVTRTANLTGHGYVTNVQVGSHTFTVNDRVINLEAPAQNISGRVLLPLRVVLENMGFQVEWNAASREVVVVDPHFTVATHDITDQIRGVATTISTGNSGTAWSLHGINASYAIMEDGGLWVWGGRHTYNPATPPYFDDVPAFVMSEPTKIMSNVTMVAGCFEGAYAIGDDNKLWSIRNDGYIIMYEGDDPISNFRSRNLMSNIAHVSTGNQYTMAIDIGGVLWGWGYNIHGQLGDGTTMSWDTPVRVLENIVYVSASTFGPGTTFAIKSDNSLWAWGCNSIGTFGIGVESSSPNPDPVRVMENIAAISVNMGTAMAITTCGELWGWGRNAEGKLGIGQLTPRNVITPQRIMAEITSVSVGGHYVMAIGYDGSLWAWGIVNLSIKDNRA